MQNFSIQEIKLLSSLELHEIKRPICKMILASFESYKRENPSCPVLISFSLTIKAQLNSLSGKWRKGQNWLLLGQWLNTKFKQLLAAIGAPWRAGRDERSLFPRAKRLRGEPRPWHSTTTSVKTDTAQRIVTEEVAAFVFEKVIRLCKFSVADFNRGCKWHFVPAHAHAGTCCRHRQPSVDSDNVTDSFACILVCIINLLCVL